MLVRASAVGTAYRITDDLVLSAQHLLGDGSDHSAIESYGAPETSARTVWAPHEKDLALLQLDLDHRLPPVASTRRGVLCSHHPDIPVEALGFLDFMATDATEPAGPDVNDVDA